MVPSVTSEATVPASFHLDRPTQVLSYQLALNQLPTDELMGIRLHRGEQGANGPVLITLPAGSRGELTVTNRVRENLISGKLYMTVYTRRYPRGELRGQLRPS